MRKTTTAICCAGLFGLLLFGVGSSAATNAFKLENNSSANVVYGACQGMGGGLGVGRYGGKEFECQSQFQVRYWNDDQTALETLESYPFDCADGQTKVVTVTDLDPYSASTRCE